MGWRWCLAFFLIALAARWGAGEILNARENALVSAHDEHAKIARSLAQGEGFRFNFFGRPGMPLPTSQQAPLVPGILAGAYLFWGMETPASARFILGFQAIFSALGVVFFARAASLAMGCHRAGIWAGLLSAVYPPLVVASCHIQAVCWNLFFLSAAWCGFEEYRRGRRRLGGSMLCAATLGAWHTDPIVGFVTTALPGILLVRAWREHREIGQSTVRRAWAGPVVLLLVVAVGLTPWTIRNAMVHERFLAMKSSLGYVFWQGNTAASRGTDKLPVGTEEQVILLNARGLAASHEIARSARGQSVSVDSTLSSAFREQLADLPSEIARMDAFWNLIVAELAADPVQYLRKCGLRFRQWLWFDETNPRSFLMSYRMSYLAVVLLATIGLLSSTKEILRPLAPLVIMALMLSSVHVLIITSARFRLPLELMMLPLASLGMLWLWRGLSLFVRRSQADAFGCRPAHGGSIRLVPSATATGRSLS